MPRNCHPSAEFHPSGLTGARDTIATQIVMDHTGDMRHQFDPADVALAGKIAGKARNRPPTTGPKRAAIRPATTVIAPPSANLARYSYQRV
jgi:hypothetical protein